MIDPLRWNHPPTRARGSQVWRFFAFGIVVILLSACEPTPPALTAFQTVTPTPAVTLEEKSSSTEELLDGEAEQQTATPLPVSLNMTPFQNEGDQSQQPRPTAAPVPPRDYQAMVET